MNEKRFEELCLGFVLENQSPGERSELESYLTESPAREARLKELMDAFHALPEAFDQKLPEARVKSLILAQISEAGARRRSDRKPDRLNYMNYLKPWAVAASFLLALVSGWAVYLAPKQVHQY